MCFLAVFCVGVPGFEPGKAGPESAVLPLHHTPSISAAVVQTCQRAITMLVLVFAGAKVRTFFVTSKFF